MLTIRFLLSVFTMAMMVLGADVVSAQNYPSKPIRIVTAGVGGTSDFMSRLIAQGISGPLGQPIIVENRPTGFIPGETVSKAPPDGYSLLLQAGNFWITPLLQKTPYDPVKDFLPITMVTAAPTLLVVNPSLPVQSVKELIALAKSKPGALNYGALPGATPAVLAAELFKSMADVNLVGVPYKSTPQPIAAVVGNEVQVYFVAVLAVQPLVKSGKLRALAVTSAQPSQLAPGLPTMASTLPGFEVVGWTAMFAPAKTPALIVNRLNQEIVRFLNQPEIKERALNAGTELIASTPAQLAATISAERIRMGKLIKDAGIKLEE